MNLMAVNLGYPELLVILVIVLVLFGASRLPQLAKALGQSKRAFREGQDEAEEEARIDSAKRRERLRSAGADGVDDAKIASDKYSSSKN